MLILFEKSPTAIFDPEIDTGFVVCFVVWFVFFIFIFFIFFFYFFWLVRKV